MSFLSDNYDRIFKKVDNQTILREIDSFINGKGKLSKTLNHFFEEIIFQCIGPRGHKSPYESLQNDQDIDFIINYTNSKPKFYTGDIIANIKSFYRNGGRLAQKVANFCPRNARDIYYRYTNDNINDLNILDTSSGFGSRMLACILSGGNYYGIDPNVNLCEKLNELLLFLEDNNILKQEQIGRIYCKGSEVFIPELSETIDISFTSPPYFNLEKYSNDNSNSTINYNDYDNWIEMFAMPTINNTYQYLKIGGYAMINIKNLTRGVNRNYLMIGLTFSIIFLALSL